MRPSLSLLTGRLNNQLQHLFMRLMITNITLLLLLFCIRLFISFETQMTRLYDMSFHLLLLFDLHFYKKVFQPMLFCSLGCPKHL